jgi:hypothetical protein
VKREKWDDTEKPNWIIFNKKLVYEKIESDTMIKEGTSVVKLFYYSENIVRIKVNTLFFSTTFTSIKFVNKLFAAENQSVKDKIIQDKEFKLWKSNRQKLVRDHDIETEIATAVGKSKLLRKNKL